MSEVVGGPNITLFYMNNKGDLVRMEKVHQDVNPHTLYARIFDGSDDAQLLICEVSDTRGRYRMEQTLHEDGMYTQFAKFVMAIT